MQIHTDKPSPVARASIRLFAAGSLNGDTRALNLEGVVGEAEALACILLGRLGIAAQRTDAIILLCIGQRRFITLVGTCLWDPELKEPRPRELLTIISI